MTAQGWLQIVFYLVGAHGAHAAAGRLHGARLPGRARRARARARAGRAADLPRCSAPTPSGEQDWKAYARTTLVFSALFFVALFVILRTQGIHPFNPEGFHSAPWDVTFNTAASFVTNTNWQFYGGETTLSYFSQMAGLAVQNFVSAAVGHGGAGRGDPRLRQPRRAASSATSGRTSRARCSTSCCRSPSIGALVLVSQGVIQTLSGYVTLLARSQGADQTLALGPGRLADRDQAARHQRRRLLQREQRDAVREPDRRSRTSSRCCSSC